MRTFGAYKKSGVNLSRAYQILELLSKRNPISYFASTVKLGSSKESFVFSVDGAGTKIELLSKFGLNWISGWDAVAMNANDILCAGAKPLWFLDYFVQGRLDKKVFTSVLRGMNAALRVLKADLIGGETAEHPGMFVREELYDIAGFLVGFRPREINLGPERVREGDILIGLASSGPHANGFSLIRKVLNLKFQIKHKNTLLAPTRLYHPYLWPLLVNPQFKGSIHSIAHITGGAFIEKIPRSLPKDLGAKVFRDSWPVPEIFKILCQKAKIEFSEALGVWNLGIGLVLICDPKGITNLASYLKKKRLEFWKIGEVTHSSSKLNIVDIF